MGDSCVNVVTRQNMVAPRSAGQPEQAQTRCSLGVAGLVRDFDALW